MKSVVLCEGQDDLWFIGYYLHKVGNWMQCKCPWKNYTIALKPGKQKVIFLKKGADTVAIWSVGGKDSFRAAVSVLLDKLIEEFPFDPINSIVMMRDRDNDPEDDILTKMQQWVASDEPMHNKAALTQTREVDGYTVSVNITPLIIPFSESGAIETVLMHSIGERDAEGAAVVREAISYVDRLRSMPEVGINYLTHDRLVLKAKYASVIAVTNPDHSTGAFQDIVMAYPWEGSEYVKNHFNVILNAISSEKETHQE